VNHYLAGAYALAAERPSFAGLARERPLSVGLARSIAVACIGALEEKYMDVSVDSEQRERIREKLRQLRNMTQTIDRCQRDFLPDEAADILGDAAAQVADETGHPHATGTPDDDTGTGDNQQPADPDEQALVSDFGFELEPSTEVLDEDWGGFEVDDDVYEDETLFSPDDEYTDVVGMFDIQLEERRMDALKTVSLTVARSMVKYSLAVIGQAISLADSKGLPGPTARKNAQAHLQWHDNKLKMLSGPPDQTMYDSAADLKKWSMQAYVESNAVEEGAAWISAAWSAMWAEIAEGLKRVPAMIVKLPGQALEAVTGVPAWLWYVGGAVVTVGLLAAVYKILTGPVGAAAVGAYVGRR
jgi:hypothetical protein